jgi:hypothetical protein
MSASNTNTATSEDAANSYINAMVTIAISVLEALGFAFSIYFIPRIMYKTICYKHKSFSIPILSYVCKQIEDFLKPPPGPSIYSFAD